MIETGETSFSAAIRNLSDSRNENLDKFNLGEVAKTAQNKNGEKWSFFKKKQAKLKTRETPSSKTLAQMSWNADDRSNQEHLASAIIH